MSNKEMEEGTAGTKLQLCVFSEHLFACHISTNMTTRARPGLAAKNLASDALLNAAHLVQQEPP